MTTPSPTVDPVAEFFRPLKLWFENIMNIYYYIVIPFFILICVVAPLIYGIGNCIRTCKIYRKRKKMGLPMKWKRSKNIFEKAKELKVKKDIQKKEERKQNKIKEKKAEWKRLYGNRAYRMTMDERIAYLSRYHIGFITPTEEQILDIQRKALIRQFEELDKEPKKGDVPVDTTSYHALHSPVPEDLANTEPGASPTNTDVSRKISLADVQIVDEEIKKMENEKQKAENKEKKNMKNMMLKSKVAEEVEVDPGAEKTDLSTSKKPALGGRFKSLIFKHAQKGEEDAKNAADGKEPEGTEEQRELRSRLRGLMSRANTTSSGNESSDKPVVSYKITSFATLVNVNKNKEKQRKKENPNDKWRRIRMLGNEQEKKQAMEEMMKNAQEEEAKNIQKQQEDNLEKRWQLQFNYFALVQNAVQQIRNKETKAEDDFVPANARSLIVPEKCYKMSRRQRKAKDNRYRWIIKLHYKDQNRKKEEFADAGKDRRTSRAVDTSKNESPLQISERCMETSRHQRTLSEKKFMKRTLIEIPAEKLAAVELRLQKEKEAAEQARIESDKLKAEAESKSGAPDIAGEESELCQEEGERSALSPIQVPDQCYDQPTVIKKREQTQHKKPLNVTSAAENKTDNNSKLSEKEKQSSADKNGKESKELAVPSFVVVDEENEKAPLISKNSDSSGNAPASESTDAAISKIKKVKKVVKVVKKVKKKKPKQADGAELVPQAAVKEEEGGEVNIAVDVADDNPQESFV
ncbi:caldesmon [Lingula anatina]|uniref:Caldesmon n=1 Tax=Lingula anatina TaxID=7574 RepID=A0A1S3H681_LINAN|nr:caldesmon [Lingula anatina]|eukprot:XP_013381625.1 caldesmon [Lingula anatina]